MSDGIKFYPCIFNGKTNRIDKPMSRKRMSRDEAAQFLKNNHLSQWLICEAIPVAENDPVFGGTAPNFDHL